MKNRLRLHLIMAATALLPLLVFILGFFIFRQGYHAALLTAALFAAGGAFLSAALVMDGLAGPVSKAAASVKDFIAAGCRLEAVLAREGWPEVANLIGALNRLMLELSAYRAFRLNEVVEERGKAQALIETIIDGVLLMDHKGGIIWSNRTALQLLGIGKLSPEVILPGSATNRAFFPALTEILASDKKYLKLEAECPPFDGALGPLKSFQIVSTQFLRAALKRPGRVVVIRDISSEKEIEKTKETFFQMVTHDMRDPLASILGYTQLLKSMAKQSPVSEQFFQAITRSSRRLGEMIDDILATTRLERGDMRLQSVIVDAGAMLARVSETYEPEMTGKDIKFSALPSSQKIEFAGDGPLLERVIGNLVNNSLKFTPKGGSISLGCRETGEDVIFSVEDTGPGIPENKRAIIFNKYVQMEEHAAHGFGLGLAMCKMAVELHKGRIWVESEAGLGSKFIFAVPKKIPVTET